MLKEFSLIEPDLLQEQREEFERILSKWTNLIEHLPTDVGEHNLGTVRHGPTNFQVELEVMCGYMGIPNYKLCLKQKEVSVPRQNNFNLVLEGELVAVRNHHLSLTTSTIKGQASPVLRVDSTVAVHSQFASKGLATFLIISDAILLPLIGNNLPSDAPSDILATIHPELERGKSYFPDAAVSWSEHLCKVAGFMGYVTSPDVHGMVRWYC